MSGSASSFIYNPDADEDDDEDEDDEDDEEESEEEEDEEDEEDEVEGGYPGMHPEARREWTG